MPTRSRRSAIPMLALMLGALLLLAAWDPAPIGAEAGEAVQTIEVPEEGFRTEADDVSELGEPDDTPGQQLGQLGAVTIPITMPYDGQATIALYAESGQLVRILGQVLPLKAGPYAMRWDGMDLFGNLVPAGTRLEVKTITTPGIKAIYQFTVGHGNAVQPFGGAYTNAAGERRTGGWLGDHSTPNAAVAVGDYVALGCFLAEAGHNLVLVDKHYEVVWATTLAGWAGPITLRSDGDAIFALQRGGGTIHRIEPLTFNDRGQVIKRKLIEAGRDRVLTYAAGGGKVVALHRNSEMDVNHFRNAAGGGNINHAHAVPQVLGGKPATEFHISAQAAFNQTFTGGGHPQAGANMQVRGDHGYIVLPFDHPVTFGSNMVGRLGGVEDIQLYALKEGLVFDPLLHSPLRQGDEADQMLAGVGMNLNEFDENWELVAETSLTDAITFLTPKQTVTTAAVYFKAKLRKDNDRSRAGLKLAQFIAEPTHVIETPARLTLQSHGLESASTVGSETRPGISVRTNYQISPNQPLTFVVDYGSPQAFDGLMLYNPINPRIEIDNFIGTGDPAAQMHDDDAWQNLAQFRGGHNKKLRSLTASKSFNAQLVRLQYRTTATALRFRVTEGYRTGKYVGLLGGPGGKPDDDALWAEIDNIALLRLTNRPADPPERILATYDAKTGDKLSELRGTEDMDIQTMTLGPDGTLYTVLNNRLHTTTIQGDRVTHTPLGDHAFKGASDITATDQRVAVADGAGNRAYIFDTRGKLVTTIGQESRTQGPWNEHWLGKPQGIALGADGRVWIAESNFAPKRISVFSAQGEHLRNLLGPPMYGGGGYLDPNLRSFYYRGVEYALDFDAGTYEIKAINDRAYTDTTIGQEKGTFAFTSLGQPYYHGDKRYIVGHSAGHFVVALHPDTPQGQGWMPAVVMGPAKDSNFLLSKPVWRDHWGAMDLSDRYFIWCDRNDNQQFEIDEVEIIHADDWAQGPRPPIGGTLGAGFVLHSGIKWAPQSFTPGGVPIYTFADAAKAPRFYDREAIPHYPRNYTLGGPTSAKPGYGDFKHITDAGLMIREGQPFIVEPDGSVLGGTPPAPSGFMPEIDGTILNQPWKFTGGGATNSEVGYVAAVNSNNGYWYVWAADLGVIVGTFFDGSEGGWNFPATRGFDATGRKHGWEAWGGQFVKAHDGNFYTVAGHTFHGISRIDGLNDFAVATQTLTVTPNDHGIATGLRTVVIDRDQARRTANGKTTRKAIDTPKAEQRTRGIKVDGLLEEWGSPQRMQAIGPKEASLLFDVAQDDRGLYIALAGRSRMSNAATDPTRMFHEGFSFDIMIRSSGTSRSRDVIPGDKRIVVGKLDGKFAAVLFDYKTPDADASPTLYNSPAARVEVARVARLNDEQITLRVRDQALGLNMETLGAFESLEDQPTLPGSTGGGATTDKPADDPTLNAWTAEVFLPWETLGIAGRREVRFDIGVNSANKAGNGVQTRHCWSDRSGGHVGDIGIEATLNPAAWGYLKLGQ